MKQIAATILALLAFAGCATTQASSKAKTNTRADMIAERDQEALRNMRDEFNRLTNDAN